MSTKRYPIEPLAEALGITLGIEGSDGAGACPACNSDGGTPIAAPTLVAVTAEPGEGRAAVRAVRDRLKPTNPKPPKTVTLVAELADGHTTTDTWETE